MAGFFDTVAATEPSHADERLRGRTYAVPFEDVWTSARSLANGGLRGWRLVSANDDEGVLRAEATTYFRKKVDEVVIRVTLDENAQTRVDARSSSREGRTDWGRNARRLARFFRALDGAVVQAWQQRIGARQPVG